MRANGKPWTEAQLALSAYMMSPAGGYGPSFLVLENYKVIRRYNMSDLYAVFVGNLADRIAGGGDFIPLGAAPARRRRATSKKSSSVCRRSAMMWKRSTARSARIPAR